jgi:hypothetical protein
MKKNDEGAIVLTDNEAAALGLLVAIRKLADVEDWLLWEDLPLLTAGGFEDVSDAVRAQSDLLRIALRKFEASTDIDSRQVYGDVS